MPVLVTPSPSTETWTRDDWNTPPWLLDQIRTFRAIGFDPCPNATSFVNPICHTQGRDGLTMVWRGNGLVFVNPPFSKGRFVQFCEKAYIEAKAGAEIIFLAPVSVETKAWQQYLWQADAWCFPSRRINFYVDGTERKGVNFASALIYFGHDDARFKEVMSPLGTVLRY